MVRLAGVAVLAVVIGSAGVGLADDTVVAVGDGFVVTRGDVEKLRVYMEKRSFGSTEEQHRKAALKIRLFAEEAKVLGLDQAGERSLAEEETAERLVDLSSRYIAKILKDYSLDDVVIESYYRAHPKKFRQGNGSTSDQDLKPLDDFLKGQIRRKILMTKRSAVAASSFERLKQKYNVRLCDPDGVGCK